MLHAALLSLKIRHSVPDLAAQKSGSTGAKASLDDISQANRFGTSAIGIALHRRDRPRRRIVTVPSRACDAPAADVKAEEGAGNVGEYSDVVRLARWKPRPPRQLSECQRFICARRRLLPHPLP